MTLEDLAARETGPSVPWKTCAVCHAIETIPPAESAALIRLLADRSWKFAEISRAIADDPDTPLDLPALALSRHARGICAARVRLR